MRLVESSAGQVIVLSRNAVIEYVRVTHQDPSCMRIVAQLTMHGQTVALKSC
jgi:hypothetical protein